MDNFSEETLQTLYTASFLQHVWGADGELTINDAALTSVIEHQLQASSYAAGGSAFSQCLAFFFDKAPDLDSSLALTSSSVLWWIRKYLVHLHVRASQGSAFIPCDYRAIALAALLRSASGCMPADDLPIW